MGEVAPNSHNAGEYKYTVSRKRDEQLGFRLMCPALWEKKMIMRDMIVKFYKENLANTASDLEKLVLSERLDFCQAEGLRLVDQIRLIEAEIEEIYKDGIVSGVMKHQKRCFQTTAPAAVMMGLRMAYYHLNRLWNQRLGHKIEARLRSQLWNQLEKQMFEKK